jgi:hypothetical protein
MSLYRAPNVVERDAINGLSSVWNLRVFASSPERPFYAALTEGVAEVGEYIVVVNRSRCHVENPNDQKHGKKSSTKKQ